MSAPPLAWSSPKIDFGMGDNYKSGINEGRTGLGHPERFTILMQQRFGVEVACSGKDIIAKNQRVLNCNFGARLKNNGLLFACAQEQRVEYRGTGRILVQPDSTLAIDNLVVDYGNPGTVLEQDSRFTIHNHIADDNGL